MVSHISNFCLRGILVCRAWKAKEVVRESRWVVFYFCFCTVCNWKQVINQLTDFHRGILVLLVQGGEKAFLDSPYVALIFSYTKKVYWNILLSYFCTAFVTGSAWKEGERLFLFWFLFMALQVCGSSCWTWSGHSAFLFMFHLKNQHHEITVFNLCLLRKHFGWQLM